MKQFIEFGNDQFININLIETISIDRDVDEITFSIKDGESHVVNKTTSTELYNFLYGLCIR